MNHGTYGYQFSGFVMKQGYQYYLVGVGTMLLSADCSVTGNHRSSISRMRGDDSELVTSHFSLEGTFSEKDEGYGIDDLEAQIRFTQLDPKAGTDPQILLGSFSFVPSGRDDRYWLISTGAFNEKENACANEVVRGEAVLIR